MTTRRRLATGRYQALTRTLSRVAALATCAPVLVILVCAHTRVEGAAAESQKVRAVIAAKQSALTPAQRVKDPALALAQLKLEKAQQIERLYRPSAYRDEVVGKELNQARRAAGLIGTGRTPNETLTGFHEKAYISSIDGSPQPYLVYVPTTYDGTRPYPLIVFLHGYAYDLNKYNWIDYMYSKDYENLGETEGYILLMPYGRSNTEFMGVGEVDVLETIRLVKRDYKIDDQRVVLSGASMGGTGAYTIACHRPHLFAGVFTITGRVDYYFWMKIAKEALPRFKQIQTDLDYPRELLPNLCHVPVYVFHGEQDYLLRVQQSRLMVKLLRELNQPVEYIEFLGEGHYIWGKTFSHPKLAAWLRERRAPTAPRKVQYHTYTLKYNRAYWVTIDRFVQWGPRARVIAEVDKDGRIRITAENVAEMTLRPGPSLVRPGRPVRVFVNGTLHKSWRRPDGAIKIVLQKPPGSVALRKTPALCGPMREAYLSRFIVVYGTIGTPEEQKTEIARATQARIEWLQFTQGLPPAKPDTAVSPQDIRDCNLILYGSPFTNAVTRRIAPQLPVRITREAYAVGERRYARNGASLLMIYPNPLNPKRYVIVADGEPWGKSLSRNHKLDLVPDFIVFTQEVDRDGTMFETNQFLCAGYFDQFWRLADRLTWTRDPSVLKP